MDGRFCTHVFPMEVEVMAWGRPTTILGCTKLCKQEVPQKQEQQEVQRGSVSSKTGEVEGVIVANRMLT